MPSLWLAVPASTVQIHPVSKEVVMPMKGLLLVLPMVLMSAGALADPCAAPVAAPVAAKHGSIRSLNPQPEPPGVTAQAAVKGRPGVKATWSASSDSGNPFAAPGSAGAGAGSGKTAVKCSKPQVGAATRN